VKERILLVLDCRMDESVDKGEKKVFAVGAVIGHETQWAWLENEWKAILKPEGIEYFRANDCAAMTGQFLKFRKNRYKITETEKTKAEGIRQKLLGRISESGVVGLGLAIDMDEFRAVANTAKKLDAFGGTPYYHCYFLAIEQAASIMRDKFPQGTLAFAYDEHQKYGAHLRDVFGVFKENNPSIARHMTTIAPFDDKTFTPIQVADLVASVVRRYTLWKIMKPKPRRPYELRVLGKESYYGDNAGLWQSLFEGISA
jgi:hypothetical protein